MKLNHAHLHVFRWVFATTQGPGKYYTHFTTEDSDIWRREEGHMTSKDDNIVTKIEKRTNGLSQSLMEFQIPEIERALALEN